MAQLFNHVSRYLLAIASISIFYSTSVRTDEPEQPVEMGQVRWHRDFDSALKLAATTKKPVLVLFQEIPGCQTCQNFGRDPLSNPLVVEAIEDQFVPVLVYNNRKGTDAELLARFSEPAWNNPVIRYLDAQGHDLIERKDGVWTTAGTAERMIAALKSANREVPPYLTTVSRPATAKLETATFAMHCYWEGEGLLAAINGVYSTRAAWRAGLEVVDVDFDPRIVSYKTLAQTAQSLQCASKIFAHNQQQLVIAKQLVPGQAVLADPEQRPRDASPSDQKYYLRHYPVGQLPLTEYQATKINGGLKTKSSIESWLSPRQQDLLRRMIAARQKNESAFNGLDFPEHDSELPAYWKRVVERLAQLEK